MSPKHGSTADSYICDCFLSCPTIESSARVCALVLCTQMLYSYIKGPAIFVPLTIVLRKWVYYGFAQCSSHVIASSFVQSFYTRMYSRYSIVLLFSAVDFNSKGF